MARWTTASIRSQKGKTFIVTGPTGLGYETGLALARAGATVILAGRNESKGASAVRRVQANAPEGSVTFELADLASLASIKAFAQRLRDKNQKIDVLINNAGVMAPPQRQITADGFELQFGTNHLGHFALTGLLLPLLRQAEAPRVIALCSIAAKLGKIHFDDLQWEKRYDPMAAYSQTKLANLMFALELHRLSQAQGWKVQSIPVHPGVSRTDLVANGPGAKSFLSFNENLFGQSAASGALPALFGATDPSAQSGEYYGASGFLELTGPPGRVPAPRAARNQADARTLWEVSERLTGVHFGAL